MKSMNVGGTDLWYVDRGAGVPLVLVHGFPLDHTMWAEQIEVLAAACRVIAPDLRGFGRSQRKKGDRSNLPEGWHVPEQSEGRGLAIHHALRSSGRATQNSSSSFDAVPKVTMEQFADDLAGLLDGLNIREPVVLCGLSMGGYIAFQFWRKYAARLRGLILCDTRAAADSSEMAAGRLTMAERVLCEGPAPLVEAMLPRVLAETTQRQRPHIVEALRDMMMASDPRGIAAAARGMAERPDMTSMLGQIRCPTLVMVGQSDASSTPAEMRGIAEAIPGATFVEIPAAGHMTPLENSAAVSAAIGEFLIQATAM